MCTLRNCAQAAINERFEALKLLRDQQYEGWVQAEARADTNLISLREQITQKVEAGIAHHKIQTIPHLVALHLNMLLALCCVAVLLLLLALVVLY